MSGLSQECRTQEMQYFRNSRLQNVQGEHALDAPNTPYIPLDGGNNAYFAVAMWMIYCHVRLPSTGNNALNISHNLHVLSQINNINIPLLSNTFMTVFYIRQTIGVRA